IALRQFDARHFGRRMVGEEDAHAEATADRGSRLTEGALTEDAQCCAMKIAYRMINEAKLLAPLPPPLLDISPVRNQISTQRQNQCKSVLWNGMGSVATYVRNGYVMGGAVRHVHNVVAGRGNRNHLQLRQPLQRGRTQGHLVGDRYRRLLQSVGYFAFLAARIFRPLVLECRRPDAGFQGFAIEKNDMVSHERIDVPRT